MADNLQLQPQVLNMERLKALEAWIKKTSIKLTQVNGQRKYGGPPEVWDGDLPGANCEVFISNISRDTYEDLLIPLFSSVGPLWEFRLMMNFSGQNRGFAYAKYGSAATAANAIRLLNGYPIEPGHKLAVRHSTEKRHLCVHNLPAAVTAEDVLQAMRLLAEGVEDVSLKEDAKGANMSAIVAFSSHQAASMAKKVIVEAFQKRWSLTVSTRWMSETADVPKPPRHGPTSAPPPSSPPPSFCRAPGGPAVAEQPPTLPASPMALLHRLCESAGLGQPLYDIQYRSTGRDGFLCFSYRVKMAPLLLGGHVSVLPGPPASLVLKEAQKEAVQQTLQRLQSFLLRL